jgi:hypothetical protein
VSHDASVSHDVNIEEDTLIVLDYDDTLLPTQWLQRVATEAGHDAVHPAMLTPSQREQLAVLESQILALLDTLQRVGVIVIITNAVEMYVELTASLFLPRVAAWLTCHDVCVMSARAWYEHVFPLNVAMWKLHAFRDVVTAWQVSHNDMPPAHMISVGDSLYERWAAHALASSCGAIKTIKLKEAPTCSDLTAQLAFLAPHVVAIATMNGDVDMSVELPSHTVQHTDIVQHTDSVRHADVVQHMETVRHMETVQHADSVQHMETVQDTIVPPFPSLLCVDALPQNTVTSRVKQVAV